MGGRSYAGVNTVDELRAVGSAILQVARGLGSDARSGERAPAVALPPLDPATRLGQLAVLAVPKDAANVLRVLAAAELDRGVQRALREVSPLRRDGVTGDAIARIAGPLGIPELALPHLLAPSGPLAGYGLIDIGGDGPVYQRRFAISNRVLRYLVGGASGRPDDLAVFLEPVRSLRDLCLGRGDIDMPAPAEQLRQLLRRIEGRPVWVVGRPGIGRRTLIAALASEMHMGTLCLDFRRVWRYPPDVLVPRLWREVLLQRALVCIHDVEIDERGSGEPASEPRVSHLEVYETIARAGLPAVFTSVDMPALSEFDEPPPLVEMTLPGDEDRLALWRALLPDCEGVEALASRFQLSPGRIRRVVDAADEAAELSGRATSASDVARAVSRSVGRRLAKLAHRVEHRQTWGDVVLPGDTRDAVNEMISRVRFRHRVLDEWGFQRKLAKGTGVVALFSGLPGTGKTMVAGLIARELGLELYQVDLSRVVSKWIGETEKSLAEVFTAAEGANVMLLFDEADSLFSKRSEVKSSNDRHANTEINYLLQRVERFDGVSVLTTNMEKSIDEAFRRRLAFRIHFPMPDVDERALLWRRLLPTEAEVAADVDFHELSRRHEMSGGRIRNAVLRAAFLAASEEAEIGMGHFERAVVLEYRDAGMLSQTGRLA